MIAFHVVQPEHPLFQDGIFFIPETDRKTNPLPLIGKPADPFFAPAPGLAGGHIVCGVSPGLSIRAVVFPYSSPLTVAKIRPPVFPVRYLKSFFFAAHS